MTGKITENLSQNCVTSSEEMFTDTFQNDATTCDSNDLLEHCFTTTIVRALLDDRLIVGMARCAQELDCEDPAAMLCVVPEDMNPLFLTLVSSGCRLADVPMGLVSRLDLLAKRHGFYFDDDVMTFDCLLILKPAQMIPEEQLFDQYLHFKSSQGEPVDLPWT